MPAKIERVMDVIEAIETRQSMGRVKQDPVPGELVERILDSAVHAPNHRLTEPWRFHVFTGEGRAQLDAPLASFGNLSRSLQGFLASLDAGELQDGSEGEPHAA